MFSNSFKNKVMKRYNISESIINRPIHYRIPDLVNLKIKPYPLYYSTKKINNSKDIETHKSNTVPSYRSILNASLKNKKTRKNFRLILSEENLLNIELNNQYKNSIKMVYEMKKYQNNSSKAVINDLINKTNHKQTTIFPKVLQNVQKSIKLGKMNNFPQIYSFFTPQTTKIKIKNRYKLRNLMEFPLKEKEVKNNCEKEFIQKEKSIDYNKYSIKIINTNNKFSIRKDMNNEDKNIKDKNYSSYYDSPIRIKSRYYSNNIINDEKEDY
jgi:hypothetical protein